MKAGGGGAHGVLHQPKKWKLQSTDDMLLFLELMHVIY
jgi:hypothetical protein